MTEALGPGDRPDVLWQRRWWMWGAGLIAIAALVVAALVVGQQWSWMVFAAGVLVGLMVTAFWLAPLLFLIRRHSDIPPPRRRWAKHRLIIYGVAFAILGVEVALLAAMFDAARILVVFVVVMLVFWLLSMALMLILVKRFQSRFAAREQT